MSQVWTFKCRTCGNALEYVPGTQSMKCPYCGRETTKEEMAELSGRAEQAGQTQAQGPRLREYHCQNCGAQIVTEETTAATRCYFCHSPVVLTDRLSDDFRPDGVIPFKLDRDGALKAFRSYLLKKRFLDTRFLSQDQLEMVSGVYYPYFLGDVEGEAQFSGEGTRVKVMRTPRETITHTSFFNVQREGLVRFSNLQRPALAAADRKLSDGVQPYQVEQMEDFSMNYLSGFLAERRDLSEDDARADMVREVEDYVPNLMRRGGDYQTLNGRTAFRPTGGQMRYVLLPAWVLTYRGRTKDRPYYYMMNGQTGAVCGRLPLNRVRLLIFSLIVGMVVTGLLCAGGALLW